jgi:phage baseplate assembly protein W
MLVVPLRSPYVDNGIDVSYYNSITGRDSQVSLHDGNSWVTPANTSLVIKINGVVTASRDSTEWLDTSVVRTNTIEFTFTDIPVSLSTKFVRTVVVTADIVEATMELVGPAVVQWPLSKAFVDTYGVTIVDSHRKNPSVVVSGTVNTGSAGSYVITYTYTTSLGNSIVRTRTVVVSDQAPVLVLSASPMVSLRCPLLDSDILSTVVSSASAVVNGQRISDKGVLYSLDALRFSMSFDRNSPGGPYSLGVELVDDWGVHVASSKFVTLLRDEHADISFSYATPVSDSKFPYGSTASPVYSRCASIVGNSEVYDVDNIIQNVYGILFTAKREHIYNPEVGSEVSAVPFSLMTSMSDGDIVNMLKRDIERWEPRCIVDMTRTKITRGARSIDIDLVILLPAGLSRTLSITYNS